LAISQDVQHIAEKINESGRKIVVLEGENGLLREKTEKSEGEREVLKQRAERSEIEGGSLQGEMEVLQQEVDISMEETAEYQRQELPLEIDTLEAQTDRNESQNRMAKIEIDRKEDQIATAGYKKMGTIGLAVAGIGVAALAMPYGAPIAWVWGMGCAGMSMGIDQNKRRDIAEKRQKEIEIQNRQEEIRKNTEKLEELRNLNPENQI